MYEKIRKLKIEYEDKLNELHNVKDNSDNEVVRQRYGGKIEIMENVIRDLILLL